MIVGANLLRGDSLNVIQIIPVIQRQPFVASGSVEPLDIGILLQLAGLEILKLDVPCSSPLDNIAALRYSGPLSQQMNEGFPLHLMICISVRMLRSSAS